MFPDELSTTRFIVREPLSSAWLMHVLHHAILDASTRIHELEFGDHLNVVCVGEQPGESNGRRTSNSVHDGIADSAQMHLIRDILSYVTVKRILVSVEAGELRHLSYRVHLRSKCDFIDVELAQNDRLSSHWILLTRHADALAIFVAQRMRHAIGVSTW